jgi:GT2 family glycosyltransferase
MQQSVAVRVSVVVASHRSAYVKDLAEALAQQSAAGAFRTETIVVADYPVEEFVQMYPDIRWISCAHTGIGVKRNVGSTVAQGDVLAFIDDDCVPAPDWIEQGLLYLDSHKELAACEGRTVVEDAAAAAPITEFKRLEKAGFRTNNIFYRKSVFESAGGFDERFTFQREDADLAFTVLSQGQKIGYCPDAVVSHRVRHNEQWDLLKNCINRRFDPLLYKKHPGLYRKYVGSPIPPGIGVVMMLHALFIFILAAYISVWPFAAVLDCTAALTLSARRNRSGRNGFLWIMRDFISFLIAPFVLAGALIQGSVKYRRWLLF